MQNFHILLILDLIKFSSSPSIVNCSAFRPVSFIFSTRTPKLIRLSSVKSSLITSTLDNYSNILHLDSTL